MFGIPIKPSLLQDLRARLRGSRLVTMLTTVLAAAWESAWSYGATKGKDTGWEPGMNSMIKTCEHVYYRGSMNIRKEVK